MRGSIAFATLMLAGCLSAPPGSSPYENIVLRDPASGQLVNCTLQSSGAPARDRAYSEVSCMRTYKRLGWECIAGLCVDN